jgi:DNA-directed RNA polymerase subunit F
MRHEITKLESHPTSVEEAKRVLQKLSDQVQPEDWRYLTECLTRIIEEVITAKGSRADFS